MAEEIVTFPQQHLDRLRRLPGQNGKFGGIDRFVIMNGPKGETLVLAACEKSDGKIWLADESGTEQVLIAHLLAGENTTVTGCLDADGNFVGVRETDINHPPGKQDP